MSHLYTTTSLFNLFCTMIFLHAEHKINKLIYIYNSFEMKKNIRNDIPIIYSFSKSFKNFFVHSCVCYLSIFIQYKYFQSSFGFDSKNNNI